MTGAAHPIAENTPDQVSDDLAGTRILVLLPSIPVQGMERATLQIMRMMRRRGGEILFVTESTYGDAVRREVERIGCRWTAAPFSRRLGLTTSPIEMGRMLRALGRASSAVRRIYRDYRPTHVFVSDLAAFAYALPVLWSARAPVVFRLGNPPDLSLSGLKAAISALLWRRCVDRVCDVLVCNSEYARGQLAKVGVDPHRVQVIYNCVAERPPVEASDAPRVNPQHLNVVYLGRLRPEKGVGELYEAARRLIAERDDVDFYWAGAHRWQNPFAAQLIRDIEARGLTSRIHVLGEIEDVFGLLAQCDLHVCPSRSAGESFPNVVLEAKMHGLPSVAFRVAGLPEAVEDGVDGWICSEPTAAALHEGLRYFLDDPAARDAAGAAAKRSLQRFSAERAADAWSALFRGAGKRKRGAA